MRRQAHKQAQPMSLLVKQKAQRLNPTSNDGLSTLAISTDRQTETVGQVKKTAVAHTVHCHCFTKFNIAVNNNSPTANYIHIIIQFRSWEKMSAVITGKFVTFNASFYTSVLRRYLLSNMKGIQLTKTHCSAVCKNRPYLTG